MEGTYQEKDHAATPIQTFLDSAGLRVESSDYLIIYRVASRQFILANPSEKTYQVMDRATLQKLAGLTQKATQEMQKALAGLTPEQQTAMRQMMGGLPDEAAMTATATGPVLYQRLASQVPVGPWKTEHYAIMQGGIKESEVWLAAPDDFPVDRDLIRLFNDLESFFEELSSSMPSVPSENLPMINLMLKGDSAPVGFPVKQVNWVGGQAASSWELRKIVPADLKPDLFDIPAGYKSLPFSIPDAE